jgi:hypothetical protein
MSVKGHLMLQKKLAEYEHGAFGYTLRIFFFFFLGIIAFSTSLDLSTDPGLMLHLNSVTCAE